MIIVENKKELQSLIGNRYSGTVDIAGDAHDGHFFLVKKCRPLVDVLVVAHVEWFNQAVHYCRTGFWRKQEGGFNEFVKSVESIPGMSDLIDFLVYSPLTDQLKEETERLTKEYKDVCYRFCKDIGATMMYPYVLTEPVYDGDLKFVDNIFCGSKNILLGLVAEKLLNSRKEYPTTFIWDSYRNPKTFNVVSRSFKDSLLGRIQKVVYTEMMNNGTIDMSKIEDIQKKYSFIQGLEISIIDLDTLTKLAKSNDNCVVICTDGDSGDSIFVKDGKVYI